ncbi:hypothetical protein Tco_1357717 [Tanacetum coccineum]
MAISQSKHNATGHQSNNNEDVSRGDKELKDSLDGGMDVKGKMVGFDQGIEVSCLNEWEGLACPPLDDFVFSYAQASSPQIDLSTLFDGIDDDYNVESGSVEKRLHILAHQQHEPRVLVEETSKKKLGVTKRKFEEENGIAKQMKMQRRTNVMQDDLLSQPRVFTEKTHKDAYKNRYRAREEDDPETKPRLDLKSDWKRTRDVLRLGRWGVTKAEILGHGTEKDAIELKDTIQE